MATARTLPRAFRRVARPLQHSRVRNQRERYVQKYTKGMKLSIFDPEYRIKLFKINNQPQSKWEASLDLAVAQCRSLESAVIPPTTGGCLQGGYREKL